MASKKSAKKKKVKLTQAQRIAGLGKILELIRSDRSIGETLEALVEEISATTKFPAIVFLRPDRSGVACSKSVGGVPPAVMKGLAEVPASAGLIQTDLTDHQDPYSEFWKAQGQNFVIRCSLNREGHLILGYPEVVDVDQSLTEWVRDAATLLETYCQAYGMSVNMELDTEEETIRMSQAGVAELEQIRAESTRLQAHFQEAKRALEEMSAQKEELLGQLGKERQHAKQLEDRCRSAIMWDELTHLPNETLFPFLLSLQLAHARRAGEMTAIMLLQIDKNEEAIIQQAAERLVRNMRKGDIAARSRQGSIVCSLSGFHKIEDVANVAEKLLTVLEDPFEVEGKPCPVLASLGISVYPTDGTEPEVLIANASATLARLGTSGEQYLFYTEVMNEQVRRQIHFKKEVVNAIAGQEFMLYYQPIHSPDTPEIFEFEALIRWRKPDGSLILPAKFLSLSEQSGLVTRLDEWMITTACKQRNVWEADGLGDLSLSVNLSSAFFWQSSVEKLPLILRESGIRPEKLEIDINEKTLSKDPEGAIGLLQVLKDLGIRLAIDDFGSGALPLSYLQRCPINTLKVDPSLVRGISAESKNAHVLYAVVSLAHGLKMRVLAEGVETQNELAFLHSLGFDRYQGTFFTPPLPRRLFADFIRKHQPKPVPPKIMEEVVKGSVISKDPVRIEVKAKTSPGPVSQMPAAVSPIPAAGSQMPTAKVAEKRTGGSTPYSIICFHCNGKYDALTASWCFCLASDQTLICHSCGKCSCRAPLEYGHHIWASAPESFWERKRLHEAELGSIPVNPPPEYARRPLILVVDDEYKVLRSAWRLITGLGYAVITAQNGEEGLKLAQSYVPTLIVSDALMPKLDGREMCRLLKQNPITARIRTVIMTAFTGASKYKTSVMKEQNFDEQLQKPVEFEKLRAVLQKLLV